MAVAMAWLEISIFFDSHERPYTPSSEFSKNPIEELHSSAYPWLRRTKIRGKCIACIAFSMFRTLRTLGWRNLNSLDTGPVKAL